MNNLSDSKRCERIRQQLDSYLSNELLVETASEVVHHLGSCESCSRDLESRMRLRDALQRAVANRPSPDSLRADVLRKLSESQPRSFARVGVKRWALGFASVAVVLLSLFAAQWFNLRRGEQLIASILKLGVSDHLICAIKGHNYPELANPPDQIREKLGPRYAPLLQVVQQRLPGFEVLEGHVCSIPGSDRKFIHFITRGQGTVLSVILTERNGASLPAGKFLTSAKSAGLSIYEDHLSGMEIAGFESAQYFAFVVSDLSQHEILQLARGLAPALNEKLHTIALLLTPNANDWLAESVSLHILRETNAMKSSVVKFGSDNKMAEKSLSSRSSFRSIIFMLLAFLAIPFPVLAQNNEITLSLGGIPSQSRPTTGERSVRSALRRCREVLLQARRRVSMCLFALVRLLG